MRRDPTEGDRATVKARLLYLLEVTERSSGWVESESVRQAQEKGWKPLTRGEVWRMAEGDRGKRPGLEKLGVIAELLGASFDFLARGKGAPFSQSDPPMRRLQQEVAELRQVIESLVPRLPPPKPNRHDTPVPHVGHIRPAGGHNRPKR